MSSQIASVNTERKNILSKVEESVRKDSKRTIIYTESDTSFYGMKDDVKILPFQAGAGKVLAAYLYSHNNIYLPEELYKIETLGALDSQGFYSDENGAFGYFRDLKELKLAIKKYKISKNDIYAFRYNSKTHDFNLMVIK